MNIQKNFYHDDMANDVIDKVNSMLRQAGSNCVFDDISQENGDCLIYGVFKDGKPLYEIGAEVED